MKRNLTMAIIITLFPVLTGFWGFYAHRKINYLAVFTLPDPMIGFYKANLSFITDASTDPDRRRYAVADEARRHYIDIDHYGPNAIDSMPRDWATAVIRYSEDTLNTYGIVPWNLLFTYRQLRNAFLLKDPEQILRVSAALGHYVGDANVPLHTTENYNGQLSGQNGIHGLWESRIPELFADQYDFFVGRASYIDDPLQAAWGSVRASHALVDEVLRTEKELSQSMGAKKYSFETRGRTTVKVYSREYAAAYQDALNGMVENQMRKAIKMTGDFWYTAWVDAGQPNLDSLLDYRPTAEQIENRKKQLAEWRRGALHPRNPETGDQTPR